MMKSFTKINSWLGKRGSRKEKVAALVVLAFFVAVFFLIQPQISMRAVHKGAELAFSPRFFPYILVLFAIIMSLVLVIRSFVARGAPEAALGPRKGIWGVEPIRRATPVVVIVTIYLLLFELLGYIISIILCYVALLWYYGLSFRKEWKVAVPLLILLPMLIYYVFNVMLYVALPTGTIPSMILRALGL